MTVRIQVIKVFDLDVPDGCEDPLAYAYGLQTTEIAEVGRFVESMTDNAEIIGDEAS